jgi:hypothetical protein
VVRQTQTQLVDMILVVATALLLLVLSGAEGLAAGGAAALAQSGGGMTWRGERPTAAGARPAAATP